MTHITPITSAARAALSPQRPEQHAFGATGCMPADVLDGLSEAHTDIIERLANPDTAPQALSEWLDALRTAQLVADQIGLGCDEMAGYQADAAVMAEHLAKTGRLKIGRNLKSRLADAHETMSAIYQAAPAEVAVSCAIAAEKTPR